MLHNSGPLTPLARRTCHLLGLPLASGQAGATRRTVSAVTGCCETIRECTWATLLQVISLQRSTTSKPCR